MEICKLQHQRQGLVIVSTERPLYGKYLLTLLIPVSLNVPVSVNILWVVVLVTGDFNLLETPLWQVDVASTKIAAQYSVLQSKCSSQSSDSGSVV